MQIWEKIQPLIYIEIELVVFFDVVLQKNDLQSVIEVSETHCVKTSIRSSAYIHDKYCKLINNAEFEDNAIT